MSPLAPGPPADMVFNGSDAQAIMCLEIHRHRSPLPDYVIDLNPYQSKPCDLPGEMWYLAHSTEKERTEFKFGFWRQTEAATEIFTKSAVRGWRTTLEFIEIQDGQEQITNWVMQEYKITEKGPFGAQESKALCKVFLSGRRSSNVEMHPDTAEAVTLHRNQIHSVASVVPSSETISKQGSTSTFLVNNGGDTKQLVSETEKHLDKIKDISELHYFLDGDYVELNDLVDPLSLSTSSDNSSRSSSTLDEYFDSYALLQELENENYQKLQGKDSNSSFSVAASVKPFEVVMQPATLGSLVCASGKQPVAGCTLPSSTLKAQSNDERMPDYTDTVKNSRAKKRHEHSSSSSSSSGTLMPRGKEKAAGVNMKRLQKYFCFMQL